MTLAAGLKYLTAAGPLIAAMAVAGGAKVSPDVLTFVIENMGKILLAFGALAGVVPSFRAVFKWRENAD